MVTRFIKHNYQQAAVLKSAGIDQRSDVAAKPSGLVLVVGPTGSGKTTTLYSMLNTLNSPERKIITVEDGCLMGGFGSAIGEFMMSHNYSASIKRLGIPDRFIEHGEQKELVAECHFDSDAIKNAVRHFVGDTVLV